jgi:hypothetical protein
MAIAIIGGLVSSTLLTLLVVPAVYSVLDPLAEWFRRRVLQLRGQGPQPPASSHQDHGVPADEESMASTS